MAATTGRKFCKSSGHPRTNFWIRYWRWSPTRVLFAKMCVKTKELVPIAVADPGFPVGGSWTSDGDTFHQKCMWKWKIWVQCRHFSPKMYAKTKELGPLGGVCRARPQICQWIGGVSRTSSAPWIPQCLNNTFSWSSLKEMKIAKIIQGHILSDFEITPWICYNTWRLYLFK